MSLIKQLLDEYDLTCQTIEFVDALANIDVELFVRIDSEYVRIPERLSQIFNESSVKPIYEDAIKRNHKVAKRLNAIETFMENA